MSIPSSAYANAKYAGIVVDAKTGKTLYSSSADAHRFPASLTKIMTLYVVFEELEAGRLKLDSRLTVSKYASGRPPSKLGLKPGSTIKVKDAILALVTKSANDVAATVAENIAGSESKFAERMTRTARQIGMKRTTFRNPHGLPDARQRTTARDMATLGRAIQERFPQYYGYFKTRVYSYNGRRYGNHNKLLGRVKGVDGIKTGYIRASGFNLVSSVQRDGRHIVAVVMGGRTGKSRDAQMVKLINQYLPRASRGPKTAPALVSRSGSEPVFVAKALKEPPLPSMKPGQDEEAGAPMVLAHTAPQPKADTAPATQDILPAGSVPIPPKLVKHRLDTAFAVANALPPIPQASPDTVTTQSIDTRKVSTQTISIAGAAAPVPAAAIPAVSEPEVADKVQDKETVTIATSDTADLAPGWQVQIAAAESEGDAIRMLKRAKQATGAALRNKEPYTEPVDANGQTLYRARFTGFETKTAAWKACKTLKKAKFACFAIYQ